MVILRELNVYLRVLSGGNIVTTGVNLTAVTVLSGAEPNGKYERLSWP